MITFFLDYILNPFIIILTFLMIILIHFLLYKIRDKKYINVLKNNKDPESISLSDLKEHPLVTIVIPAWNEGLRFKRCLESIENLTYPNLEVIVNAGGSEETIKIANSYKNRPNFRIIYQKGGGKIKALNECIPYIKGKVVYLVDADVYFTDEILIRMIHPIVNLKEDVVIGGIKPLKEQANKDLIQYLQINRNKYFRFKFSRYQTRQISGANTLLSSKVLKSIGKFNESKYYAEDRARGEDIRAKGFKIYSLNDYRAKLYSEFPDTIKKWINQKLRWNENFIIYSYQKKIRKNLIKFILTLFYSFLIIILPILSFLHLGFLLIELYILFFTYCLKIRRFIFHKKIVDKRFYVKPRKSLFLKMIFYIFIEVLIYSYIPFELLFTNKFKKKKNINVQKN